MLKKSSFVFWSNDACQHTVQSCFSWEHFSVGRWESIESVVSEVSSSSHSQLSNFEDSEGPPLTNFSLRQRICLLCNSGIPKKLNENLQLLVRIFLEKSWLSKATFFYLNFFKTWMFFVFQQSSWKGLKYWPIYILKDNVLALVR